MIDSFEYTVIHKDGLYYVISNQFGFQSANADFLTAADEVGKADADQIAAHEKLSVKLPVKPSSQSQQGTLKTVLLADLIGTSIKVVFLVVILAIGVFSLRAASTMSLTGTVAAYMNKMPQATHERYMEHLRDMTRWLKPALQDSEQNSQSKNEG